jgi:adenosylhomocysteine nucleosidase
VSFADERDAAGGASYSHRVIRCALIVGMVSEAQIARRSGLPIAIGGGTTQGARVAVERLLREGAESLISFGLAGGLDPALVPGDLVAAEAVLSGGRIWPCDAELVRRLSARSVPLLLAGDAIVATAREKARLYAETGAAAVDLESGAIAELATEAGVPFAVLRAICDGADRTLPRAAVEGLDAAGRIAPLKLIAALLRDPAQISGLIALGRDAARARSALLKAAPGLVALGS